MKTFRVEFSYTLVEETWIDAPNRREAARKFRSGAGDSECKTLRTGGWKVLKVEEVME
jgi:hypothetical protein